jgi:hypothetical protein
LDEKELKICRLSNKGSKKRRKIKTNRLYDLDLEITGTCDNQFC